MANKRTNKTQACRALLAQGISHIQIACALDLDRTTVSKIAARQRVAVAFPSAEERAKRVVDTYEVMAALRRA